MASSKMPMTRGVLIGMAALALVVAALAGVRMAMVYRQDYSTPRSAVKSMYVALVSGDTESVRAHVAEAGQAELVEELKKLIDNVSAAMDAAAARFGADSKPVSGGLPTMEDIDSAAERIDGETATLAIADGSKKLRLMKSAAEWKVDLLSLIPFKTDVDTAKRIFSAGAKSAVEVKEGIVAGKYKTAQEAEAALVAGTLSGAKINIFDALNIPFLSGGLKTDR